jgi:hypothetical protein
MTDWALLALLAFVALWWVLSTEPKGDEPRVWTWKDVAVAVGVWAAIARLGTVFVMSRLAR